MMYYDYGNGGTHWAAWILMIIAMIVFWGALAWVVVTVLRHRSAPTHPLPPTSTPGHTSSARAVLDERYARGEIDEDEYKRRRSVLDGDS